MQSLHFNSGSIKLTRERATMVSRWESNEVARWIAGLAGIQSDVPAAFMKFNVNGAALSTLLRDDLIRMGITQLDQQLILTQSIDLLLSLVNRLSTETLAFLFMRIHCLATACVNMLKRQDDKEIRADNSRMINSPEFYTSISNLSDAILETCHWLGRLPFIENTEYINLRRKIIKALVQIRVLIRNLRLNDQINMPKTKLILEINELRTTAISLVRQNKDSLFTSDCYLARVNLRRPIKDDVNIEYTTMPNFTHVISSIETEAMTAMGSGFSAINIGDEIIEINDQVVIGWDPEHFNDLVRSSANTNEICLLVKKMPRHNDDEAYTKRLADFTPNHRRNRARGTLERQKQQAQENRTMLLEQEGEIEVESDDETLYQSKRSSQIKRDQHSSLPDLSSDSKKSSNDKEIPNTPETLLTSNTSTISPIVADSKHSNKISDTENSRILSNILPSPKSSRKMGFESYFSTLFRSRQDSKSILADSDDGSIKDQPQLVNLKRLNSIEKSSNSNSNISEEQNVMPGGTPSRSSISNIFRTHPSSDSTADKTRSKRSTSDGEKSMIFRNELKMEIGTISQNPPNTIVANKPPLNHSENRKNSMNNERRRPKRPASYKKVSCKDLGKGDCEGSLYRYLPKGTISLVQWRLYWCVLKGGTLYVFKSKDDKNQEVEIKLHGKNVSPTPERRKHSFCISDETRKTQEYFCCSTRDEMAKWMNKMGLAAINFNMDDSKIGGFHKGFVDSREGSPATTPILRTGSSSSLVKSAGTTPIGSAADSENDSDKDSVASWHKSNSHHSSVSDTDSCREKNSDKRASVSSVARHARSSSSSASLLSDTNSNSTKNSNFNRFVGQIHQPSEENYQRISSSPVSYEDCRLINAAPRLSDSDSSSELPHQRMLNRNPTSSEFHRSLNSDQATVSNTSSIILPVVRRRSSLSLRNHQPMDDDKNRNYPAITSPQYCSPGVIRSSPLYISVQTSTPAIPIVKGTVSTAAIRATKTDDDELFFTRRSPSPKSSNKANRILSPTTHPNSSITK